MPELVRLYIRNIIIGFVLALIFTATLIALDVASLRHLVTHTQGGVIAVIMLVVFNTIVFAGVQFAIAIMRMAEDDSPPRGGRRIRIGAAQPITAIAQKPVKR